MYAVLSKEVELTWSKKSPSKLDSASSSNEGPGAGAGGEGKGKCGMISKESNPPDQLMPVQGSTTDPEDETGNGNLQPNGI